MSISAIHSLALCILHLASPQGFIPSHFARSPMGPMHRANSLATTFTLAADANGLDVAMLVALAKWESDFNDHAISSKGAFGVMQLAPRYHWEIRGFCRRHPELCGVANINRGAKVLAAYKRRCRTDGAAIEGYRSGRCRRPGVLTMKVIKTRNWIHRRLGASHGL